jgi:hypothetical protein
MSVRTALLSLVVVNFASLIPLTMGGIGTIDAAGPLFLISSGVTPHIALAMVLLQHAAQYLFTTISGGIVYLAGGFHRLPLARPKTAAHRRPVPATGLSGVEQTHSSVGQISPRWNRDSHCETGFQSRWFFPPITSRRPCPGQFPNDSMVLDSELQFRAHDYRGILMPGIVGLIPRRPVSVPKRSLCRWLMPSATRISTLQASGPRVTRSVRRVGCATRFLF